MVLEVLTSWAATQLTEKEAWDEAYHDARWIFTREDGRSLPPDRVTKVASRLLRKLGLADMSVLASALIPPWSF